jgi:hypothetical protein
MRRWRSVNIFWKATKRFWWNVVQDLRRWVCVDLNDALSAYLVICSPENSAPWPASALLTDLHCSSKGAKHDFLVDMDSHKIDDGHKFLTGKCHFGYLKTHGRLQNIAICKACLRRDSRYLEPNHNPKSPSNVYRKQRGRPQKCLSLTVLNVHPFSKSFPI